MKPTETADVTATGTNPTAVDGATEPTERDANQTSDIILPAVDTARTPGGLIDVHPPGKIGLIDFFATTCPPCSLEMVNLRSARERFSPDRVSLVSVTPERDRTSIRQFWEDHRGTWPVVTDPDQRAFRKHGVLRIPTIIVLLPDGTEASRHTGLTGEAIIERSIQTALDRAGQA